MVSELPEYLHDTYDKFIFTIEQRLEEFRNISPDNCFYEFCFCILTPQSKAKSAWWMQRKLEAMNFFEQGGDMRTIARLLRTSKYHIRFHNVKTERLFKARDFFPTLQNILASDKTPYEKRFELRHSFNGLGMKESSHFLRNIGYSNIAIIDRHVLRHLYQCGVIDNVLRISDQCYLRIENEFLKFADQIKIPVDILDLLFFAHDTGEVLK